jgi:tetratricopeptide (TPR) repeat protein/tRNA A-37 threonylcarbamoyl transferase component Bud32
MGATLVMESERGAFDESSLDRLLADFSARWKAGDHRSVGVELQDHPPLAADPMAAASLIYREFELRRNEGQDVRLEEFESRYPRYAGALRCLVEAERFVRASPLRLGPGVQFGNYFIEAEIAQGGMGIVYRARDLRLKRPVALKMIRDGQLVTEDEVERFNRESEAAALLDHPNIVPIFESGQHEGHHFYSMAYVEGRSLHEWLDNGPLSQCEAAGFVKATAEAVHYAHQRNVIHRDLKPANILIGKDGQPRVTDFGLAKKIDAGDGPTLAGRVMGTPSYMPPEQAEGHWDRVGLASDIYSLGATLYALLTGRPPFQAATAAETTRQVLNDEPIPLRRLNGAIHRDLETICLKCLEKDPDRRYSSAQALADDLECFLGSRPIAARPVSPLERLYRWGRRNPKVAGLTTALMAVSIAAAIGLVGLTVRSLRKEQEALRQVAISEESLVFLTGLLSRADPQSETNRNIALREVVDRATEKLDEGFLKTPEINARLRIELGKIYHNLGEYERSRNLFAEAYRIAHEKLGESHPITMTALARLGKAYMFLEEFANAERALLRAYELQRTVLGPKHQDTIQSYAILGYLYCDMGKLDQAEEIIRKVLDTRRRTWGDEYEFTLVAVNRLGLLYRDSGRPEESLPLFEQAEQIAKRTLGELHPSTLRYMHNRALSYADLKRWGEAQSLFSECLTKKRKLLGDNHPSTLQTEYAVADIMFNIGKYDESRNMFESILERQETNSAKDRSFRGTVLVKLGKCFTALEKYQEAEQTLQRAQKLLLEKLGPNHRSSRAAAVALEELLDRKTRTRKKNRLSENPRR